MSKKFDVPIWKTAPFIRLLLPLIAGIIFQWYQQLPLSISIVGIICFTVAYLLFFLLPLSLKFKLHWLQAIILNLVLISAGMLITWQKDIRHTDTWFGQYYHDSNYMVVRIDEPLIEKAKSFKADGYVEAIIQGDTMINTKGKILLYFSKESLHPTLHYGDKILLHKNLQGIKNSGNPGAFNYERYAAFQQLFHNVFLKENDWIKLEDKNVNHFKLFLFTARENVLSILRKHVNGSKDELGIAQALLIGYTNDLDKDLVQAYSNTGVVHIIAISGMHLGLIYLLLAGIFKKLPMLNRSRLLQVVLILSCLWLFSLLTGASASVIRAAVMFSFIAVGSGFNKQSSIYNSLAASAFVMLCYNPYYLWDVGFQLSYLAVVSIIVFQKVIYNWWYIKYNWLDKIWKLVAISLSAQILTFPICIYYFHQFPNFFLLANIIAVPLSSIILYAEIGLVAFSWVPYAGSLIGKLVTLLVWVMNKIVLWLNEIPFAVWDEIPSSVLSTWLLYAVVISFSAWLINKKKGLLSRSLIFLLSFTMTSTYSNWQIKNQQKLIVYNVPQHQAIDFINGNHYYFVGDSILLQYGMLQNFHLKPARIALQLNKSMGTLKNLFLQNAFYQFNAKRILLIDSTMNFEPTRQKTPVDIIIISKNPSLHIAQLAGVFNCGQYVFDASNSMWKIGKWQKDCEELHLRSYSVSEQGAFVLDVRE